MIYYSYSEYEEVYIDWDFDDSADHERVDVVLTTKPFSFVAKKEMLPRIRDAP